MQMPEISRRRALAYIAALLVLLVVSGRFLRGNAPAGDAGGPASSPQALKAQPAPERLVVVDVVGAVRRPGLYRLRDGSRTADAIAKAGGSTAKAALELINLAAPVADGQQVVVPRAGGSGASAAAPGGAAVGTGASAAGLKVHLNSASLEQLDTLPGVGPVTAQKILDYRSQHGAFASVGELDAVPGIGPARLEQLKPLVDL
jgi:competence protein ComEA